MFQRFFVATSIQGDLAILTGAEAHHLTHVMRAKPGTEVVLFDGTGIEATARIEAVSRSDVKLQILTQQEINRERAIELNLGVALPKGERQRQLVEKSVELGVRRLVPLRSERGVAAPTANALSRLRRTVIEASKQCGRNRLMEVAEPQDWAGFVSTAAADQRWLAHPGGEDAGGLVRELLLSGESPGAVDLAIGPEGGFSDEEVALARASNWQTVDLGPAILRVETAAAYLVALAEIAGGRSPDQ